MPAWDQGAGVARSGLTGAIQSWSTGAESAELRATELASSVESVVAPPPAVGGGASVAYARSRPRRYYAEEALLNMLRPQRTEIEELLKLFWLPASLFGGAEVAAFCGLRKSFFEALTNGAFELGPRFEAVVEIHVWASVAMWSLAGVQILWERARRNPDLVWLHRAGGKAMLGMFYAIVFPTSLYLTVMQRVDYISPAVGAVLLDTAFCTSYFLYRGWRVARRPQTAKSLSLHGRLMQCGVVMSMSILPQRFLQLYLTAQLKQHHQLNYTISILVTAILFVLFGHFSDGPRGGIWASCIGAEQAEEAYGSATPSHIERWAWRLRWLAYAAAYSMLRCWLGVGAAANETPAAVAAPSPSP